MRNWIRNDRLHLTKTPGTSLGAPAVRQSTLQVKQTLQIAMFNHMRTLIHDSCYYNKYKVFINELK